MRYFLLILLSFLILGSATPLNAQLGSLTGTEINISLIPQNPKPGEAVTATISSFSTNINNANITWRVNGKVQKTGVGIKTINFVTGGSGTKTVVDITVNTEEGASITQSLSVEPNTVDIIWQSDSFVPPFYKGKAMFAHENKITFIAIPHMFSAGEEINPKNLTYIWKENGKVIEDAGGYGRNTYSLVGSLISRSLSIEVNVSNANSSQTAQAVVRVDPINPSILIYEISPLYGVQFQRALSGTVSLETPEIAVLAVPMFFGVKSYYPSNLTYKWYINNRFINNNPSENEQVFRQKEGVTGISKISVQIENSGKILQFASGLFNLGFGKLGSQ